MNNQFTADLRDLDPATRDYLGSVAASKGNGAPGIYTLQSGTGVWGCLSFIVGGTLLFFGLGMALASPKEPWATALLLTAALMLGGWMVLYPIRRMLGGGLGKFSYFDSHNVYQVNGREVTVTNIAEMSGLEPTENLANNNYSNTALLFRLPGKAFTAYVSNRLLGEMIVGYYANLGVLESDAKYQSLTAAERGGIAKYMAAKGEMPGDPKLVDLTINEVPEEPSPSKTIRGSKLRYLAILLIGGLIHLGSWQLLKPVQDDMAFDNAQKHGLQGYRDYLLDANNTRHRDKAKAKIAEHYANPISIANKCADPVEKKAWVDILTGLSQSEGFPVVSFTVVEDWAGSPRPAAAASREQQMRTRLSDGIGSLFGPNYIVFVEPPEGAKPLVELTYRLVDAQTMTWYVTFRDTPDAAPIVGPTRTAKVADLMAGTFPPRNFEIAFYKLTFDVDPPTIFTEPHAGWDVKE